MDKFEDVKEALEKALKSIITRKNEGKSHPKDRCIDKMNAEGLERAACNHLFDDYPELYGITEWEGHLIRAYFNVSADNRGFDYIIDLHKHFPKIIEDEDSIWLNGVNKYRKTKWFEPIIL